MILHFPTLLLLVPPSNLPLGFSVGEVKFPVSHFAAVLVVLTSTSPSVVLKQVGCSVVGVASPAGRFTGLVCSLGVTLF